MTRYLLDTNVLVYALDASEPTKQTRALDLIARVGTAGPSGPLAALPAQALAEFARVALGKLAPPLTPDEAHRQIELYERAFPVLALTPAVVLEAVRGVRDHSFSYFDAQIWAVARLNQIPVVLSEDFAAGSTVEGITFTDPFDAAFDLATL
ncbi:MAG: PIN domain-containing protein [Bacteroidota bacterium]